MKDGCKILEEYRITSRGSLGTGPWSSIVLYHGVGRE